MEDPLISVNLQNSNNPPLNYVWQSIIKKDQYSFNNQNFIAIKVDCLIRKIPM